MEYQEYIRTELLVLIPVLYIVGIGLKRSKIPNKFIPLTLGCISIVLSALWVFATEYLENGQELLIALFTSITQGILIAGASVYLNQLIVQSKKEK